MAQWETQLPSHWLSSVKNQLPGANVSTIINNVPKNSGKNGEGWLSGTFFKKDAAAKKKASGENRENVVSQPFSIAVNQSEDTLAEAVSAAVEKYPILGGGRYFRPAENKSALLSYDSVLYIS